VVDESGIELQHVPPRLFGRIPPLGLLGAGAALLLAAVVFFSTAHWLAATFVLVLALLLLGLYVVAARHVPPSEVSRRAVGGVWRARDELRFAGSSTRAWTGAGRQVLGLQRELRKLSRERDGVQHALGGAVHRDDGAAVEELRGRMRDLDERAAACVERIEEARRTAEQRVAEARIPLGSTEIRRPRASRSGRAGTAAGKSRRPRTRLAG
jgi:hypothetical protein